MTGWVKMLAGDLRRKVRAVAAEEEKPPKRKAVGTARGKGRGGGPGLSTAEAAGQIAAMAAATSGEGSAEAAHWAAVAHTAMAEEQAVGEPVYGHRIDGSLVLKSAREAAKASALSLVKLRRELKQRGIDSTGVKGVLVDRLQPHLDNEEARVSKLWEVSSSSEEEEADEEEAEIRRRAV